MVSNFINLLNISNKPLLNSSEIANTNKRHTHSANHSSKTPNKLGII
jgi:hypothetical protein